MLFTSKNAAAQQRLGSCSSHWVLPRVCLPILGPLLFLPHTLDVFRQCLPCGLSRRFRCDLAMFMSSAIALAQGCMARYTFMWSCQRNRCSSPACCQLSLVMALGAGQLHPHLQPHPLPWGLLMLSSLGLNLLYSPLTCLISTSEMKG